MHGTLLHVMHGTLLNYSTIVSFNKVQCNRVLDQRHTNVTLFRHQISQLSTDSQLDVSCSRQAGKAHVKEGKFASGLNILH